MSVSEISDSNDVEEDLSRFHSLGSYRKPTWFCWCGCSLKIGNKFHQNSAITPFTKDLFDSEARMPSPAPHIGLEILSAKTSSDKSVSSRSSSDSLSISDGLSNENSYKGPNPPSSKASSSNSISSSKISYHSPNIRVTSDDKNIFIKKKDIAMEIEKLEVEKEKIYEEILLMEENLKVPKSCQKSQEKLEMPTNFEEIAENLKMHLEIYNLYIEHINYLSLEAQIFTLV